MESQKVLKKTLNAISFFLVCLFFAQATQAGFSMAKPQNQETRISSEVEIKN